MPKIFIFEFFSGGGLSDRAIPNSLLSEGFAMLATALEEFSKIPDVQLMTTLDYRIYDFNHLIATDWIVKISERDNFALVLESVLNRSFDGALVIAPETGGILYNITKILEVHGVPNLGCRSDAIQLTGNKFKTLKLVEMFGVLIPKTHLFSIEDEAKKIFSQGTLLGLPFVMKPIDGVSGAGLQLVNDLQDVVDGIIKIRHESPEPWLIVQEYIKGTNVSTSLIVRNKKVFPLTLNHQAINLEAPDKEYQGGHVPFEHALKDEILAQSIEIARRIPGFQGYFGMDFVVTEDKIYFMEINPRLTTSFIGISKIAEYDLSELIFSENIKQLQSLKLTTHDTVYFSKIKLSIPSWEVLSLYLSDVPRPEIIAPPFLIKETNQHDAISIIATTGKTLEEARERFDEVKKELFVAFQIS